MELLTKEAMDDVAVVGGLVAVQAIFAGNSVLLSYVMSLGLNPLTLIIFSAFATFLILSPVAVVFERRLWPKKITVKLIVQLVLISFGGCWKDYRVRCSYQRSRQALRMTKDLQRLSPKVKINDDGACFLNVCTKHA